MDMNPLSRTGFDNAVASEKVVAEFFRRVYLWMAVGLTLTGTVALGVASTPALVQLIFKTPLFYVVLFAPLAIVIGMSWAANRISSLVATGLFLVYAFVNGLTFASIFLVYTRQSIASTFFITAGSFAALSFFGFVTKKDLTAVGRFFFIGLVGIIIASIVNIFLGSPALTWAISVLGVLIFAGLTAYDTQKLRKFALANGGAVGEPGKKVAIFGALTLYLDFINLFLFLLRLFGDRRR